MSPRRAKLVCTLGPASAGRDVVMDLIAAGTDVFRVNLSHGDADEHAALVATVRAAAEDSGVEPAVMADLPGPKIRLGEMGDRPVRLEAGSTFVLRPGGGPGDVTGASTTYADLGRDVRAGDRILLADGTVELCVRETGAEVITDVVKSGSIRSRAGVNVPAERLSLPAITERDRGALTNALDLGVDLIAQSFVRTVADVIGLRALMGWREVPIVAKIETRPAVEGVDAILTQADAIMVARGDLGVELPMEEIPVLQKELLRSARAAGRPAIVATQMLESMLHAPRPTRAEASDVANAVLDGADAIMLSGETAIGEYPLEAARAAERIAGVAEERAGGFRTVAPVPAHADEASAVAHAAAQIAADDPAVVAIACYTETGRTAGLLSVERPAVPIYAFVPDPRIRRALNVRWGVRALPASRPADTDAMIALMANGLRASGVVREGRSVVMAASMPAGKAHTNMLKVHQLGEPVR
ncbi:MAG TPA: pyruvate kinase [Actinomycetota bacterium]|nr:pyruvate kinase [Actinomycetota bacterium]